MRNYLYYFVFAYAQYPVLSGKGIAIINTHDPFGFNRTVLERLESLPFAAHELEYVQQKSGNMEVFELPVGITRQIASNRAQMYPHTGFTVDELAIRFVYALVSDVDGNIRTPMWETYTNDTNLLVNFRTLLGMYRRELENYKLPKWLVKGQGHSIPLDERVVKEFFELEGKEKDKLPYVEVTASAFHDSDDNKRKMYSSFVYNGPPNCSGNQMLEMIVSLGVDEFENVIFRGKELWRHDETNGKSSSDYMYRWRESDSQFLNVGFQILTKLNRFGMFRLPSKLEEFIKSKRYLEESPYDFIWQSVASETAGAHPHVEYGKNIYRDEREVLGDIFASNDPDKKAIAEYVRGKVGDIETLYLPTDQVQQITADITNVIEDKYLTEVDICNGGVSSGDKSTIYFNKWSGWLQRNFQQLKNEKNKIDWQPHPLPHGGLYTVLAYYGQTEEETPKRYFVTQFYLHDAEGLTKAIVTCKNLDDPDNLLLFKIREIERTGDESLALYEYYTYGNWLMYEAVVGSHIKTEKILDVPQKIRTMLCDQKYALAPQDREIKEWLR